MSSATSPPPTRVGFSAISQDDGTVKVTIMSEHGQIADVTLAPDDVGALVTLLLKTSNHAFFRTGAQVVEKPVPAIEPIPVKHWGTLQNHSGQHALSIQVGETVLPFEIVASDLRKLGRNFIGATWRYVIPDETKIERFSPSVGFLAGQILIDFWADVSALVKVIGGRLKLRRASLFETLKEFFRGERFREFSKIQMGPNYRMPKFRPVKECIYCNAKRYTDRPGIVRKLGGEHVIPEGLGGKLELPEASCESCERVTGATVERLILNTTLKALRAFLKLRKPGGTPYPTELPLNVVVDGVELQKTIPIEEYPIFFHMDRYYPPPFFKHIGYDYPTVAFPEYAVLRLDERLLTLKHGLKQFRPVDWKPEMLHRLLAKIGHSFAVSVLGQDKFSPYLKPFIVSGGAEGRIYIGGEPKPEKRGEALHTLSIGYQRNKNKDHVVVKIRILAQYGAPTYVVVVGEALESRIRKLIRVLYSKISSMQRR